MKNQTCIGILGGVGPQATEYLYRKIMNGAVEKYGANENHHFPRVLIISEPVIDFISSTEYLQVAKRQILQAVGRLIAGGATHVAIASNTVHLLLEDIAELCNAHGVECISMLDAVSEYCSTQGYTKVGLLGSPVTLQSNMYDRALENNGVTIVRPPEHEFEQLGCIIKAVIADTVDQAETELFMSIVTAVAEHADAVLLGCTELPVLASELEIEVPVVDTSAVLAEALLRTYYSQEHIHTKEHRS